MKCYCEIETSTKVSVEVSFIVKGKNGCLISWKTWQTVGLVQSVESDVELDKAESLVESPRSISRS